MIENMKITGIDIIDPETELPVPIETWKNSTDPTAAEYVLVRTDELEQFVVRKNSLDIGGRTYMSWQEAVDSGKAPTRAQAFAIYDALHRGLDKAIRLIGGEMPDGYFWTSEACPDPDSPTYAWGLRMDTGSLKCLAKTAAFKVLPVCSKLNSKTTALATVRLAEPAPAEDHAAPARAARKGAGTPPDGWPGGGLGGYEKSKPGADGQS